MEEKKTRKTRIKEQRADQNMTALEKAKAILASEHMNYWILAETNKSRVIWDGSSYYFGKGACEVFLDDFYKSDDDGEEWKNKQDSQK